MKNFMKKEKKFEVELEESAKKYEIKERIVELNVGGKIFTTLKSTLLKAEGTMLGAMFSGRYDPGPKDKEGRYFLDRPSKPFSLILNSLRTDTKLQIPEEGVDREILLKEIKFYAMEEYFKEELREPIFHGTKLLKPEEMTKLNGWIKSTANLDWKLCYRGTSDGFLSSDFHKCVDGKGENVVLVQDTSGYLFGGYVPISWCSAQKYVYDTRTFLFSLTNPSNKPCVMPNTGPHISSQYSIYDYSSYGPTFGGGHDLYICSGGNGSTSNYCNLGHSFTCQGYTYGSTQIQQFFCGAYNFQVKEVEVFRRCKEGENL